MNHSLSSELGIVKLLPMTVEDSERYRELRNIDTVRCWFGDGAVITQEAQRKWFDSYLSDTSCLMLSIWNQEGCFVGGCSLYDIRAGTAEFGRIIIDPRLQGRGYGVDATKAALIIAKGIGLHTVRLEVRSKNIRAIRAYLSAGYYLVGARSSDDKHGMTCMEIGL